MENKVSNLTTGCSNLQEKSRFLRKNVRAGHISSSGNAAMATKALLSIPIDCPALLDKTNGYNQWLSISTAYKAVGGSELIWHEWCSGNPESYAKLDPNKWLSLPTGKGKKEEWTVLQKFAAKYGNYTPALPSSSLDPWEQSYTQIKRLFQPDEHIAIITACNSRANPAKPAPVQTEDQMCDVGLLLDGLEQRQDLYAALVGQSLMGDYTDLNPIAGAWMSINPLDGKGFKDENVTSFRNILIECDNLPVEKQYQILMKSGMPIATITHSGGKSLHAIVQVNSDSLTEYRKAFQDIRSYCSQFGMTIDRACSNPARLTRLAGVMRNGTLQELHETDLGPIDSKTGLLLDFDEWAEKALFRPFLYKNPKTGRMVFSHSDAGDWCLQVVKTKTLRGGLYSYDKDKQIYVMSDLIIRRKLRQIARDIKEAQIMETLKYVKDLSPAYEKTDDAKFMAFSNGLLDLQTHEMRPYDKTLFITSRVPHPYIPEAHPCSIVDETFLQWACGDAGLVQLMYEWIGYQLVKAVPLHKFMILTGDGCNGKSVYCSVLKHIVGPDGYSSMRISELEGRFNKAGHLGKLANIADENEGNFMGESPTLKTITGGGNSISAEFKGQDTFVYEPYSKQTFSFNNPPTFRDPSGALKRRMLIMPFRGDFRGKEDMLLTRKLTTPEATAYIISKAVPMALAAIARGYFHTPECVQVEIEKQDRMNNPEISFIEEMLQLDELYFTDGKACGDIYNEYKEWAQEGDCPVLGKKLFSSRIQKHLGLVAKRKSIHGGRSSCWIYVKGR